MCGITGIVSNGTEIPPGAVERMTDCLQHRGPDAQGYIHFPACHLGHRRLSIIDLETGSQPMGDTSGRYWISFNGEIYNYRRLRAQLLEKNYDFKTQSDTEVILAAYSEWGAECLNWFRGMFAFAIWDTRQDKLFAARDLFGEKPFYYAFLPDGSLLFGSEIKAILASGLLSPELDLNAVDAYLALGYVPPDRTIYKNIQVLAPGHFFECQAGSVAVSQYWNPELKTSPISLDEAASQLRELFFQAIRRQMVADVPVGAFLSGGLDSSTIVALMQMQASVPVKTFSVGFGQWIDELPYARQVANRYRTEHYEIDLENPPVGRLFEHMALVYDEPFGDSSNIPTYLIAQFARRQVKVVLSGDGGDELFGGYEWYPPLVDLERISTSWASWFIVSVLRGAWRVASRVFHHTRGRAQAYAEYVERVRFARRWPDTWMRHVMQRLYFSETERSQLWGGMRTKVDLFRPDPYYLPAKDTSGVNRAFYFDLTAYLPGDILTKLDRAAMAHSLETRTPFLDRDLVEFALTLPARLKVTANESKIIMYHALSTYWPKEIRARSKQGFGAPYATWLGIPELKSHAHRVFAGGSSLSRLLPGLRFDQISPDSYQTWILLTLGVWLEHHGVLAS